MKEILRVAVGLAVDGDEGGWPEFAAVLRRSLMRRGKVVAGGVDGEWLVVPLWELHGLSLRACADEMASEGYVSPEEDGGPPVGKGYTGVRWISTSDREPVWEFERRLGE